jgi:tRNA(adenine34) deaminase
VDIFSHEYFMKLALGEAKKAFDEGEVPVGAVVVYDNKIIGRGYNLTERLHDVTAHAEMQAITAAANYIGAKYLTGCKMYVTLEPCVMCAGALYWSQIDEVIIGTRDEKRGYISQNLKLHPKTKLELGVLEDECSLVLKTFFKNLRG